MSFPVTRPVRAFFASLILMLVATTAQAAILIVTNTDDSGPGSLRDTIAAAGDGDTIQFDAALKGQAITLTTSELQIQKKLAIEGPGADQLTVQRSAASGTPAFSVFYISSKVSISGLTIANGNAPFSGGGIAFGGAGNTLTVANCIFSGNSAANKGGALACGEAQGTGPQLAIINSTFSDNTATSGGAIDLGGSGFYFTQGCGTTIENSTITGNRASSLGGGICNRGGLWVQTSTISANESTDGGGIHNIGSVALVNSTISGNSASGEGGGIKSYGPQAITAPGTVTTTNTTISGNSASAGGGLNVTYFTPRNTIIALNTSADGPDVKGLLRSKGFNLVGNDSGATISEPQPSDQIGTSTSPIDPKLGPLQDNGGPTFTHALLPGSPAKDQGESSGSTTDQRGFPRPVDLPGIANAPDGDGADIGAFESASATLANISTRGHVGIGDKVMIGGFIITGTEPKTVVVRARGPSLSIAGALADPVIEVYSGDGVLRGTNDNWNDAATRQKIIDSGLAPTNDLESALWGVINPGVYTVIVHGKDNGTGIGLFEVYDLDPSANSTLANVSTRGFVETGDNVLIGGFLLRGDDSHKVIVRAIGPSLSIPGALPNPTLELHDGNGGLIAANDDWRSDQEAEIVATTIPPSNDLESAIVRILAPGDYTAIVHDAQNASGIALVEVYALEE
jgi:predicted outer membrane repeat protein